MTFCEKVLSFHRLLSPRLQYYNFLPNDLSEFKLDRKTHGLSLNLTDWCYFKSQRCTSRGVYMLATLRLYQRRQNGVLCTEGISLQVAIRAWTKVEKISLGGKSVEFPLEPLRYYNFLPNDWSELKLDRKTHELS